MHEHKNLSINKFALVTDPIIVTFAMRYWEFLQVYGQLFSEDAALLSDLAGKQRPKRHHQQTRLDTYLFQTKNCIEMSF